MPWGTVDDRFYDHDKVLAIPVAVRNEACGLYWRANSYCNAKLTDGFVADGVVDHLDGSASAVEALVAVKLWHRKKAGYVVHDFLDGYNRSRADVENGHRKKAEAGRLGGVRSGQSRRKQDRKQRPSNGEAPASGVVGVRLNSESPSESDSSTTPQPPASGGRRRTRARDLAPMRSPTRYDDLLERDDDVPWLAPAAPKAEAAP